jgi:uncharacterized protein involved in exopolysaccharide biosynthesis
LTERKIRFVDFLLPLIRRRKLIVSVVVMVTVGSVAAALLWPKSWRATVTLLPPERRMDNPMFIPGGFENLGASLRGITLRHVATPTDIFVAILESRNVAERIVERFDLAEEYDVPSDFRAANILRKITEVAVTQDGTIAVRVIAKSAEQAAEMANAYVEELDRVNRTLAFREASAIREFVQTELDEAKERLVASEEELRIFQETHGAIAITEQAKAVISAAAEISARILGVEVELGVLRRTRDDDHPDVIAARDLVHELRLRLAEIEGGGEPSLVQVDEEGLHGTNGDPDHPKPAAEPPEDRSVFPPLSRVPGLGLEFGRRFRALKTEEAVVTLLTEQYHRARIEERRSLPTVRVLDEAVPPERRYRPQRTMMVLMSTGAGVFAAVLLAYTLEIIAIVRRDPVRYAGLHEMARDLRKGFRT